MANIKSSKKRIKVIAKKTLRNTMVKSALKTYIKKFEVAVSTNNHEDAKLAFTRAQKALDMAATKGVIHKNKASRKKSRLQTKLNKLSA